jgi:serine/threonine-protein kinase
MLHRDIKPGNILLSATEGVKVADFGIVKAPGSVHTTTGQLVGTLAYLSPDRIGGIPASVADDLYAVGVVGYEALTARKPFIQEDIAPLARAITNDQPPPLAELRPDVDPRLIDVIERAMSRDPLRRFSSAEQMWTELGDGVGRSPMVTAVPVSPYSGPATGVRSAQFVPPSEPDAVLPFARRRASNRIRTVVGTAAVLGALAITAMALALDSSSSTLPSAPEPVGISTPAPPQTIATAVPTRDVRSLAPVPSPTVEPAATLRETPAGGNGDGADEKGRGNGNGNGNGHGKKPK